MEFTVSVGGRRYTVNDALLPQSITHGKQKFAELNNAKSEFVIPAIHVSDLKNNAAGLSVN